MVAVATIPDNVGPPPASRLLYKHDFCKKVIKHLDDGLSLQSFGPLVGVTAKTIYEWKNKYAEFDQAIEIGRSGGMGVWETRLKMLAITGKGSAPAIIFAMTNLYSDVWKSIQDTRITIGHFESLTDEQLAAQIKIIEHSAAPVTPSLAAPSLGDGEGPGDTVTTDENGTDDPSVS